MDYRNFEARLFEMETEIVSLNEALLGSAKEKEEACTTNIILESKVDSLSDSLNAAELEIDLLKEEIVKLVC